MKSESLLKDSTILFFASIVANVFNLLYQLFMARNLEPVDFGVLNMLLSLLVVTSVPVNVLQTVTAKFMATFKADNYLNKISLFLRVFFKRALISGLALFLFVLISSGKIAAFFKIQNRFPVIMSGLIMMVSTILPFNLGGLQGLQKFKGLGATLIISGGLRLLFGIVLVNFGLKVSGALGAIVLGSIAAVLFSSILLKTSFAGPEKDTVGFDDGKLDFKAIYKFALPILVALPSFSLLTNMDVIFVKHLFSPLEAGYYSIAQMVGKVIFFLPSAVIIVMFPKASANYARNENTTYILKKCLIIIGLLCFSASGFCIIFPELVLKMLSGRAYLECIPLIAPFSISMSFFALINAFLFYHLSVNNLKFIYIFLAAAAIQVILILLFHGTLLEVLYILVGCSILLFLINCVSLRRLAKR
ncbi:MAG: oligosaccharide flippase family protein [Candidatus Omnitrophota bacterium]